jgi:hypothetical protein
MSKISQAATVVAVLCTSVAFGTATLAFAETQPPCRDITQDGFSKMADTFTCFLQVDKRVIINGRCWGMIAGNTKYWSMRLADVYMKMDLPDHPYHARLFSFKRNLWVDYGQVEAVRHSDGDAPCWANTRFKMCFRTPYLICHPESPPPYWTPSVVDAETVPANATPQDENWEAYGKFLEQ